MDASDADDEHSSSGAEEPADLSDEGSSSEKAAVTLYDEGSSSEESAVDLSDADSQPTVELSNEQGSSSEDSDDIHSQQPFAASQAPPLDFPTSPAPLDTVLNDIFNMEGYDQQPGIISDRYATEEEVWSFPFNVIDYMVH